MDRILETFKFVELGQLEVTETLLDYEWLLGVFQLCSFCFILDLNNVAFNYI